MPKTTGVVEGCFLLPSPALGEGSGSKWGPTVLPWESCLWMLNGGVEICREDCTGCAICAKMGKASPLHSCFPPQKRKDVQVLLLLPAVGWDGFRRGCMWVQRNQC